VIKVAQSHGIVFNLISIFEFLIRLFFFK